ncbi:cysteine desulfurase [Salsuginibacillus halophilus]|uniref:Cysteine desulfurase n=1 Tax=Salsuginibacillus halophilus TaxID=517424 RepID=A0A2P8HFY8_9BACI|nr:IscS subfamily cysteine desulfurase [Salsuginibacillus halophilus]PSL45132.1 cysteine desulfurase [Salsuginibacillus halophilus]
MIYLDYAATTPMSKTALKVYNEAAETFFANPSSLHDAGGKTAYALNSARRSIARLLHVDSESVHFTGSGSEANILPILATARANRGAKNVIAASPLEHPSVYTALRMLETEGFTIQWLPVDFYGRILPETLENVLNEQTCLCVIGHASADFGTIQPLAELACISAAKDIPFHSDCVQTFGKIPLPLLAESGVTSIAVSAHKVHGPVGTGACWIDSKTKVHTLPGVTHENGLRPGTVDTAGALSFAAAAEEAVSNQAAEAERLAGLTTTFLQTGRESLGIIPFHPPLPERLPHFAVFQMETIEGQWIMLELNRRGIAAATGSACTTGSGEPSPALKAAGRTDAEAFALVRLSFGKSTTKKEVADTLTALSEIYAEFKQSAGIPVRL